MTDHPEHRLSAHVFGRHGLIERIVIERGTSTAVETGTWLKGATDQQRFAHEERRKKRGIKPSHLDGYCYGRESGEMVHIELKYGDGRLTTGEEATMAALTAQGIPNAVCWTVLEVYHFLTTTRLRLHGNAANIAAECEARWRAADELERGKPPAKKRPPGKPREKKATAGQIKRFNGVRARFAATGGRV
jgi:hypothetical protein